MMFERYIGIDYSGAQTPSSSLKGIRAYAATSTNAPTEVQPPPSPRKYWTRRGIADWLETELSKETSTIVGIDHGFSFPVAYFERYSLSPEWGAFLADFQHHWPTQSDVYVDFIREGMLGNAVARQGERRWRRLTEIRSGSAKSVFHFDVRGSVAKSTHAGLPWLLRLRQSSTRPIHFWPFDGWDFPSGSSVVSEVYPSLWSRRFPDEARTADQHDAYSIAEWLRQSDQNGDLARAFRPCLEKADQSLAEIEGWILGVA